MLAFREVVARARAQAPNRAASRAGSAPLRLRRSARLWSLASTRSRSSTSRAPSPPVPVSAISVRFSGGSGPRCCGSAPPARDRRERRRPQGPGEQALGREGRGSVPPASVWVSATRESTSASLRAGASSSTVAWLERAAQPGSRRSRPGPNRPRGRPAPRCGRCAGDRGRHRHVGCAQGQFGGDLHVGVDADHLAPPARSVIGALKAVLAVTIISSRTSRSPLRATSPAAPSPWDGSARSGGVATTPSAAAR